MLTVETSVFKISKLTHSPNSVSSVLFEEKLLTIRITKYLKICLLEHMIPFLLPVHNFLEKEINSHI